MTNAGVERYRNLNNQHLECLEAEVLDQKSLFLKVQTTQSKISVAEAATTRLFQMGQPLKVDWRTIQETGYVALEGAVDLKKGESISIEKVLALYSSRDHAISECGLEAQTAISRAARFSELLRSHSEAWNQLWQRFDMDFEEEAHKGNRKASLVLRLHIFHLLQVCSPHTMDLDVGAPARGLHGEAYRGHIFWDEIFIFPFLNFRMPEITRSLLMYRFRRLPEAQRAAQEAGYQGAMYRLWTSRWL